MHIKGTVEYNKQGAVTDEKFEIDTNKKETGISKGAYDAISFALFGKTVFHDIIEPEKGVPLIILEITCKEKAAYVVRQPEYIKETHFGKKYLNKELFSLKIGDVEYKSLSDEKYHDLLKECIDMSFDDFSAYCRS